MIFCFPALAKLLLLTGTDFGIMPKNTKMTFKKLLKSTDSKNLIADAKNIAAAQNSGLIWDTSVDAILKIAAGDPDGLAPNIKESKTESSVLKKWLQKYADGHANRISQRVVNLPRTVADPIVETIISCRLPHLKTDGLAKISFGHRLSMTAENVLGHLLEEFLANELAAFKWHCCWGETLRSVDFVNEDGRLLQVKNRSNSENSSSSRVRIGTEIEKWFRVNANSGKYLWEDLNKLHSTLNLSEENFKDFVVKTLKANPKALPVELANPWIKKE